LLTPRCSGADPSPAQIKPQKNPTTLQSAGSGQGREREIGDQETEADFSMIDAE